MCVPFTAHQRLLSTLRPMSHVTDDPGLPGLCDIQQHCCHVSTTRMHVLHLYTGNSCGEGSAFIPLHSTLLCRYPGEIVPGLLYLGNWEHAQDFAALHDLGIKRYTLSHPQATMPVYAVVLCREF